MKTDWIDGAEWPDWRDSMKRVEVDIAGRLRAGILLADDFIFTGDDECPLFIVKFDDGSTASFGDVARWRFIA